MVLLYATGVSSSRQACVRSRTGPAAGFTLVELLIVLVVLAIVCLLAAPQFASIVNDRKLDGAAAELVVGLQYAGHLAVAYRRPFGVTFDTGRNQFAVFDARYRTNTATFHDADPPVDSLGVLVSPFDRRPYVVDLGAASSFQGVALTAAPQGGEIRFYPDGHSTAQDSVFVLTRGNRQRTVTVNAQTGFIAVN